MDQNATKDFFYFLDYARLLIEEEYRNGHHVNGYRSILEKYIYPMRMDICGKSSESTETDINKKLDVLRQVISMAKEISNDLCIMRALLRTEQAMKEYRDATFHTL